MAKAKGLCNVCDEQHTTRKDRVLTFRYFLPSLNVEIGDAICARWKSGRGIMDSRSKSAGANHARLIEEQTDYKAQVSEQEDNSGQVPGGRLHLGSPEQISEKDSCREREHALLWTVLGHWRDRTRHHSALVTNARRRNQRGAQIPQAVAVLTQRES